MKIAIRLLVILLLLTLVSSADRGLIPFPGHVRIDESGQNAIVAWNGDEEVLILSTDVKSSEPATILEVITLPTNPTSVKEGSFDSFTNITRMINRKSRDTRDLRDMKMLGGPGGDTDTPGIEITFHKKIGAHDITVVKVNDLDCFIDWIKDFTAREGFEYTELSSGFRSGVSDCIDRKIIYFVFDVIRTGEDEETVKPLIYTFESDFLYYPLEITAISDAGSSYADVNLFLITEGMIDEHAVSDSKLGARAGYLYGIRLNREELEEISLEIKDMFESDPYVLNAYHRGALNELNKDLVVYREDIHVPTLLDRISQRISVLLIQYPRQSWGLMIFSGALQCIFDDNPDWVDVMAISYIAGIPSVMYIMAMLIRRSIRKYGFELPGALPYAISIVITAYLLVSTNYILMYDMYIFTFIGFSMIVFLMARLIKHIM